MESNKKILYKYLYNIIKICNLLLSIINLIY